MAFAVADIEQAAARWVHPGARSDESNDFGVYSCRI